jgi:hypothetical protein
MIIQITKENKTYQAYAEKSISGNIIIEIFELRVFNGYTSHHFIKSHATQLKPQDCEYKNSPQYYTLIKLAEDLIINL